MSPPASATDVTSGMKQEPVGSPGLGQAQPAAAASYGAPPAPPAEVEPRGVAAGENPTAIRFLQRLVELNSEDTASLEKDVRVLKNLKVSLQLSNCNNTQAPHWLESIDRLLNTVSQPAPLLVWSATLALASLRSLAPS